MDRLTLLEGLAKVHHTDKLEHGYLEHYASVLPKQCSSLLEIGAAKGYSLLMWNDFYGMDNVDIHCLDLFINPEFVNARWCRNHNFVPHTGDQSDLRVLSRIHDQFNVIIDDGSHNSYDQLLSFKHLFLNNLLSGGLYVIEDCHCCKDPFYWNKGITSFEETALHLIKEFIVTHRITHWLFNEGEAEVFESVIDKAEVLCNDKMICIWKK